MFVYVTLIIFLPVLFAQITSRSTKFTFAVFRPDGSHHFITLGDVQRSPDHLSFTTNEGTGNGAATLLFSDKVRMRSGNSGAVASFSTFFT